METDAFFVLVLGLVVTCTTALSHQNFKRKPPQPITWKDPHGVADYFGAKCTPQERQAIQDEMLVSMRITGKYTHNETILPLQPPTRCTGIMYTSQGQLIKPRMDSCFEAWGMTPEVAQCWTDEVEWKRKHCYRICKTPKQMLSRPCGECQAKKIKEKFMCTARATGVSEKCAVCRAYAQEYYTKWCTLPCAYTLSDPVNTDPCKFCNDHFWSLWRTCFEGVTMT